MMSSNILGRPAMASKADGTPATARRGLARAIDLGVILVPTMLIAGLTGGFSPGLVLVAMAAAYVLETLMVALTGATVGKHRMGLRVVDVATGGRPLPSRAGRRFLVVVGIAAVVHLFVPVGPAVAVFLWGSAGVAADGRGIADRVAGTRVEAV